MEQETQKAPELRITPEVAAAVIADKCRKDDEFSKSLRGDPRSALIEASGKSLPDSMNVVVHQNSADHWHIVIPSDAQVEKVGEAFKMMDDAGGTLSDEQLLAISGGEVLIGFLLTAALVVGTGVVATAVTGGVVGGAVAAA